MQKNVLKNIKKSMKIRLYGTVNFKVKKYIKFYAIIYNYKIKHNYLAIYTNI